MIITWHITNRIEYITGGHKALEPFAPPGKNTVVSDYIRNYKPTFFYLKRLMKKLTDDQCSARTKGSIAYMKHVYIQPFAMEVDWPEIEHYGSI